MKKNRNTFKNSLLFLLGAMIYSFLYWATGKNQAHVFGMLLLVLACNILYVIKHQKERVKTESVICMCAGVIFDSLSSGFPFGFF
ncbi:MAG: hypothetical protein K2P51_08570 [Rhabdochlamydiaceae bacterium]|nr:hypothetical protein [Rhabdochlamydiaceae bacterium]